MTDTDHIRCVNEGGHVATQRHPRSECPEERTIDDRLRATYATAMKHTHDGGRVEIHIGSDVFEYLRSLATVDAPAFMAPRCWGFPVVTGPALRPDHMSVHVVHTIY